MNLRKSIRKRTEELAARIHRFLAPAPLRTYDHILSLGFNCEVAFQFLKYNGFLESCMFNWYATESTSCLMQALSDLNRVGADFIPEQSSRMWIDVNVPLHFHGKGNHHIWRKGADASLLEADKAELISRMGYLKSKLLRLAESDDSVLFVYKPPVEELEEPSGIASNLIEMRNILTRIGFRKFDLMTIVTQETLPAIKAALQKAGEENSFILEHISYHAPVATVTEGPYDIKNWRRIWAAYRSSFKPVKRKKNYKFQQS